MKIFTICIQFKIYTYGVRTISANFIWLNKICRYIFLLFFDMRYKVIFIDENSTFIKNLYLTKPMRGYDTYFVDVRIKKF